MALPLTETDKFLLLHAIGAPESRDRVTALLDLAGTGNMTGPASATDNALARYDGATGALLQNSIAILSDAGVLSGLTGFSQLSGQVLGPVGSDAAPSFASATDTNTGLKLPGGDVAEIVAGGSSKIYASPTQVAIQNAQLRNDDGTVSAPAYSFSSDVDTGIYRIGADSLGFSAGGVLIGSHTSSGAWTFGVSGGSQNFNVSGNGIKFAPTTASSEFLFNDGTGSSASLRMLGGANANSADIQLYGSLHATKASVTEFKNNGSVTGSISSGGSWSIGETGSSTTHFVRANGVQFAHSSSTGEFQLAKNNSTSSLSICGDSGNAGGEIEVFGSAHASAPNQIRFFANGTTSAVFHNTGIIARIGVNGSANLSDAVAFGFYSDALAPSTTTSAWHSIVSKVRTANASFTVPISTAFLAETAVRGAASTITRYVDFFSDLSAPGSNNAVLADNQAFTGNYFIHSTSTRASVLGGDSLSLHPAATGYFARGTSINTSPTGAGAGYSLQKNSTSGEFAIMSTGTGGSNDMGFYTSNSGAAVKAGGIDQLGGWTLGQVGGTAQHVINTNQVQFIGSSATGDVVLNRNGDTAVLALYGGSSGSGGRIQLYGTSHASQAKEIELITNTSGRLKVDATGNVVMGTAALATTATDGFFYASTSAGAPTGVPTAHTGRAPIHIDTTNGRFYAYYGGAWHFVALA